MRKQLKIKVRIDSKFEIDATPNLKEWNDATDESKNIYVKERLMFTMWNAIINNLDINYYIKFYNHNL